MKKEFIKYLEEHPDERFWQALRNFSNYDFIMGWKTDKFDLDKAHEIGMEDTFYIED